jgi:hypothetical protein
MLITQEISGLIGRVCYITEGSNSKTITIECPIEKKAFTFEVESATDLLLGDFIEISGTLRVDPTYKHGKPREKTKYYHKPYDGTNVQDWNFFQLRNPKFKITGPVEIMKNIKLILDHTSYLLDTWTSDPKALNEFVETLDKTSSQIKQMLIQQLAKMRELQEPVKTINITC